MKTLSLTILSVIATGLFSFGPQAQAVPINGTVAFQGSGSYNQAGPQTNIVFNNPMTVTMGTGNYVGTTGQSATFTNFSFTGTGNSAALVGTVTPLWTFTVGLITFSFDLTSLTSGTVTPAAGGNPNSIAVSGKGTARETGFDPTFATFALNGSGTGFTFTVVQSSTTATGQAVPDGGSTVALLGIALLGVAGARRMLASKVA